MRTRKVTLEDVKSGRITKDSALYTRERWGALEEVKADILEAVRDRIFLVEYEPDASTQTFRCFDAQGVSVFSEMELLMETPLRLMILKVDDKGLHRVSDHGFVEVAENTLQALRAANKDVIYHLIDADDPTWRPSC
jgi:hypothetical protein